jgi:hypothetical protein
MSRVKIALAIGLLCGIVCAGLFILAQVALENWLPSDLQRNSACCVVSSDGVVYLQTIDLEWNSHTLQSHDGGLTWERASAIPTPVSKKLAESYGQDTSTACNPSARQFCYRISPRGLDDSDDGGESWQSASTPFDVQMYSQNGRGTPTRTLTFVESGPSGSSYNLIVALGTQGVSVRFSDGTWRQHSIDELLDCYNAQSAK